MYTWQTLSVPLKSTVSEISIMAKKRGLLLAKMDPPARQERQWNDYYNSVHVADRLAIPGFLSARRFTRVDDVPRQYAIPGDATYLAIYDVDNLRQRVPPGLGKGSRQTRRQF
jgi:hypothetical protein